MSRRWPLALLPALLGLAAARLLVGSRLESYDVYLSATLPAALGLLGVLLSTLLIGGLLLRALTRRSATREATAAAQGRAAEERRRFLGRLDHELKNPLTALRAALANLGQGQAPTEIVSSMEVQTLRLSRLTADLRKLAELESRPLERAPVEMGALLEEAVALAAEQPEASRRELLLRIPQAPWPLPAVSGDWDLLFLAIYNLLSNALKFTAPGDTVEVRGFENEAAVVVEVADTGPGIDETELPLVWEELYRGEGARGVLGSGLGLALTRAVIERHGGESTIRSRSGQGTVVTLRLPLAGP